MRALLVVPILFFVSCVQEASVAMQVVPVESQTITLANGATLFSATLSEALIELHSVSLLDGADVETQSFLGERELDLLSGAPAELGVVSLIPREIAQLSITPGDASDGDLIGLTLRFSYAVTLTDTTTSNVLVELSTAGDQAQKLTTDIFLLEGDALTVSLAFDPSRLLSGVDYDALNQNGAITIRADTADPAIDAALLEIKNNLFTSFSLSDVR